MLLQKILKSSLIMIMSLNLMLIDFQIKTQTFGFNVVSAQSEGDVLYTLDDKSLEAAEKEQAQAAAATKKDADKKEQAQKSSNQNTQNSNQNGVPGISNSEQSETNQIASSTTQSVEGKDLKSDSWAATLAMVAIGLVTSRLVSCKMTVDMGLAAAGGVAFIAGEITSFVKLRKALKGFKAEIDYLAGKEKFDAQRIALLKIREGYVKALETAEMKKTFQLAAAAAFGAAAAAAGMAGLAESNGLIACTSATDAAAAQCKSMYAASCAAGGSCYGPFLSGAMSGIAARVKIAAGHLTRKTPAPSVAKEVVQSTVDVTNTAALNASAAQCPPFVAPTAVCSTFFGLRKMNSGACSPGIMAIAYNENGYRSIAELKKENPSYWNRVLNMIIPEAKAFAGLAVLGIGAKVAIKYVLATSAALATKIDLFLHESFNRMKIWIALAGLTYMASNKTQEVIDQLKGYIDQIDGVLSAYEEQKAGPDVASGTKPQQPVSNFSENKKNEIIKLPGGKESSSNTVKTNTGSKNSINSDYNIGEKTPCLAGEKAGKCTSFGQMITSSSNFSKLDPKMQQQFQNIAKTMDKLSGTDTISSGTLADLNAIAKNSATNVSSLKEDLIKKYKIPKEELKDIDKNQNELLDTVNKELKKQNTTAQRMYASFNDVNPAGFNSNKDGKSADSSKAELASLGNIDQFGLGPNSALNGLYSGSNQAKDKDGTDHSAAQSEVKVEDEKKVDVDQIHEIAGQFGDNEFIDLSKMGGNLDINKDDQTSLFQVISNRYQKTGYNRLFPNKKAYEIEAQR